MPTTPRGYRYPADADPPDGPQQLQELATDIDTDVSALSGTYLALAAATVAKVDTAESTTSGTYTDLATVGPAVTVTVGASGRVLCLSTTEVSQSTAGCGGLAGIAISGATTQAAGVVEAINFFAAAAGQGARMGVAHMFTGLAAGSTTFTHKYRIASGGTATFLRRQLIVIPL